MDDLHRGHEHLDQCGLDRRTRPYTSTTTNVCSQKNLHCVHFCFTRHVSICKLPRRKQASSWAQQSLCRVNVQAGLFKQNPTLQRHDFRNLACRALHSDHPVPKHSHL